MPQVKFCQKTLIIDHNDSYTFNLYHLCKSITKGEVVVVNYQSCLIEQMVPHFDNIILSPGPGCPSKDFNYKIFELANCPIFGICLGHQAIGTYYGAMIDHGMQPMHGRIGEMKHFGDSFFDGIPREFSAVEYHSLIIKDIRAPLKVTCTDSSNTIMGIKHLNLPIYGVQFHPESICTQYGDQLLRNFYKLTPKLSSQDTLPEWILNENLIPKPLIQPQRRNRKLKVYVKRLLSYFDCEDVFSGLFQGKKYAFFLDSAKVHKERGRFSYVGAADGPLSYAVSYKLASRKVTVNRNGQFSFQLKSGDTFFHWISQKMSDANVDKSDLKFLDCDSAPFDFFGGFVGNFGYEMKQECFPKTDFRIKSALGLSDASFLFIDRFLAVDNIAESAYLVFLQEENTDMADNMNWIKETEALLFKIGKGHKHFESSQPSTLKIPPYHDSKEYMKNIKNCQNFIRDGESYELCLTTQFSSEVDLKKASPWKFYTALRRNNPAPYGAFFSFSDYVLACSSPELFIKVDTCSEVIMKPIKGTLQRQPLSECQDYNEWLKTDTAAKLSLATSEKDRAENLMIVDLIRNDLSLISESNSVTTPSLMQVESYATVHQMVSTVKGKLRRNMTAVDAIKGCFPPGSMTGAPKLRSIEILESLEGISRGVYSGIFGYLSVTGTSQFNVIIRSAVFDLQSSIVSIGAGGAIISISSAVEEWEEVILKSNSVLKTVKELY